MYVLVWQISSIVSVSFMECCISNQVLTTGRSSYMTFSFDEHFKHERNSTRSSFQGIRVTFAPQETHFYLLSQHPSNRQWSTRSSVFS